MEYTKRRMQIEAKKIVDSVVDNNRAFYWKVALLIIIISDDGLKEHMEIINRKYEDNYFVMNSMEEMIKIFKIIPDKDIQKR